MKSYSKREGRTLGILKKSILHKIIELKEGDLILARALSKLGVCSRSTAPTLIREGRVRLNGRIEEREYVRVDLDQDRIEVDGRRVSSPKKIYLMLNKPRGLVTTASDEKGRRTVYDCFHGSDFPWSSPVGRLDKASEGLL